MVRLFRRKGRGVSLGTILMLSAALAVLLGGGAMLMKLRGHLTLTTGQMTHTLTDDWSLTTSEMPTPGPSADPAQAGLLLLPAATAAPAPTHAPTSSRTVSLVFGGSTAVQSDVRQSCYYTAARSYDFGELFSLIREKMTGDWTGVTLENLFNGTKYSDLLAPDALLADLRANGVQGVALGFPKCLDKGGTVLQTSVKKAQEAGLTTLGAFLNESDAAPSRAIMTIGGVRVAILHYTDGLNATNLRKLKNTGISWAVAVPDQAAADIAQVKQLGAELVIVTMSWGKASSKAPTAGQKALAQRLADAGADVIIGAGTHTVQTAEWLRNASGHRTLCCYGLGNLMSESRTDEGVAGLLVRLTFTVDADGALTMTDAAYTPTYTWHYKQDGAWHFRIVNAAADAPDGMEASQQKSMTAAYKRIVSRLGSDTPLRLNED